MKIHRAQVVGTFTTATGSTINATGSFRGSFDGDGKLATTGSNTFSGNQTVNGSLTVTGNLTAQQFIISSSVTHLTESFASGSHKFGDSSDDTHTFTGSLDVSGSSYFRGNVGIGTTSPSQLFEVVGGEIKAGRVDSTNEGGQVSFGRSTDNNTSWYIDAYGNVASPQLRFVNVSDSLVAMTITGSNAGIGTSTPNRLLEVSSGGDNGYIRVTGNRGNADGVHVGNVEFYNSFSSRLVGEIRGITGTGGTQSSSGELSFYTNNAGTYAERMRIASTGNVGIGTTNPGIYKVSIVNNGVNSYLGISNQGTTNGDRQLRIGFGGNGSDTFASIQGTRYNIADDVFVAIQSGGGQVGIGTTSIKSLLGSNTKLTVTGSGGTGNGSAGGSIGSVAGSGTGAINLGISINGLDGGMTLLFLASRNTAGGTSTASAVYIISFYYSDENFPAISYLGGTSNFVSFGTSGNNLTATNSSGGNHTYSWFANK